MKTVTIYIPDSQTLKYLRERLSLYNHSAITSIVKLFAPAIKGKKISYLTTGMKPAKISKDVSDALFGMIFKNKRISVEAAAILLGNKENFMLYYDSLALGMKTLLNKVLNNFYVSTTEAENLTNHKVLLRDYGYIYYLTISDVDPLYAIFSLTVARGPKQDFGVKYLRYLYLNDTFRNIIASYIPVTPLPIANVPDDQIEHRYHIFSGGDSFFNAIGIADTLAKNDMFNCYSDKLTLAEIKKIAGVIRVDEFFPDSDSKEISLLRIHWILSFYLAMNNDYISSGDMAINSPERLLHYWNDSNYFYNNWAMNLCFPNIKGLRKNYISTCGLHAQYKFITQYLKYLKGGKWHPVTEIVTSLSDGDMAIIRNTIFNSENSDKMTIVDKSDNNTELFIDDFYTRLGIPAIKAILFGWAAVGIIDIAYDMPAASGSPYDGLAYIKLTALGAYLLGYTNDYQVTDTSSGTTAGFELDQDNLIVYSHPQNQFESLMLDFGKPVGEHRFVVTTASLIGNCNDIDSLSDRITRFKTLVNTTLPPNWQKFINNLLNNQAAFKKESLTNYKMYTVDQTNQELLRMLASDPKISPLILKADDFHILIKRENISLFKLHLRSYGYMLPDSD